MRIIWNNIVIYIYSNIHIYIYIHMYMYMYMYVSIKKKIYIYIYIHIHSVHIYIYTQCIYIKAIFLAFRCCLIAFKGYVGGLTQTQGNCTHFFRWFLQHSHALDFAFYGLQGWTKVHHVQCNFQSIFWIYCIDTVCLCNDSNNCAAMMVLDCLPLALPCSYRNTSKQWPLRRNINP